VASANSSAVPDLQAELSEVLRQLHLLRGVTGAHVLSGAEQVAACENQALRLRKRVAEIDPASAAELGYPVLDDLTDWRETLLKKYEITAARAEAEFALRDLLAEDLRLWREDLALDLPDAETIGRRLWELTRLVLDIRVRCPNSRGLWEPLIQERLALRVRLQAALAERVAQARPLDRAAQDRWAGELVDQADLVLTTIDELDPAEALAHVDWMADDLRWHLAQVATLKGQAKSTVAEARRRLLKRLRRLEVEWQERTLQGRLEARFGKRLVRWHERLMLVLIALVLVILAANTWNLPPHVTFALEVVDTLVCLCLLQDFCVRFALAPWRGWWFWRHWLTDLLPALPLGILGEFASASAAGSWGWLPLDQVFRVLRLTQMARYVALARPLFRVIRAYAFLTRGLDRLVRRSGTLLNRNVILYPNVAERLAARQVGRTFRPLLLRLRTEIDDRWEQLLAVASPADRVTVALLRIRGLEAARQQGLAHRPPKQALWAAREREIPLDTLLERLCVLTPQSVETEIGEDLRGWIARTVRLFSQPPVVWLPLCRSLVPRTHSRMSDAEIVAAAGRHLGSWFRWYQDLGFWAADLYGTVTPSQFVDRVGTMMIKSSATPAYRLLMFGGVFLLIRSILYFTAIISGGANWDGWVPTPHEASTVAAEAVAEAANQSLEEMPFLLRAVDGFVSRYVGPTLLLLGGVCLVFLSLGIWLRRLAREATDFLERSAHAQFLALTENIRSRNLRRDGATLYDRVLRSEWLLYHAPQEIDHTVNLKAIISRMRQSLLGSEVASEMSATSTATERVLLLYRNALDGALLADSDTRTSSQLLGNPALRQLLWLSQRFQKRDRKALEKLDLRRQQSAFTGPYIWFNFICRAVAHAVGHLLLEYNRQAIPLSELPLSSESERRRYEKWLRAESTSAPTTKNEADVEDSTQQVTTAFTVLHFLDDHPLRDREVQRRFGPDVLARLRRDRKLFLRRVFGMYPFHTLPKEQRILNLFAFYEHWFARGRVLLLPWYLLRFLGSKLGTVVVWFWYSLRELLRPETRADTTDAALADYATAVRKIDRMRAPIVQATLRLRLRCDPEYFGFALPGQVYRDQVRNDLEADLRFLTNQPWLLEEVAEERKRVEADLARWEKLLADGLMHRIAVRLGVDDRELWKPEPMRAAAMAYVADLAGVRRHLSALTLLAEQAERAVREEPPPATFWQWLRWHRLFARYWKEQKSADSTLRLAAWRAVAHNQQGAADALAAWGKHGPLALLEGERLLSELMRHPGRLTEQLVSLRTIQTLALLDVLNYREHVYRLGDYAADGEPATDSLAWGSHFSERGSQIRPALPADAL